MEITGDYNKNAQYYPEIYTLCTITGIIIVCAIISSIYYFVSFPESSINKISFTVNIILSSGLMAGFLCIFFFTYLDGIEKQVFINNISDIIYKFISNMPSEVKTQLKTLIQVENIIDINSSSDIDILNNNADIKLKAFLIFGAIALVIIFSSIIVLYLNQLAIIKTFGINLLLLSSIAIIEFLFATYFVTNYINIDINNLVYNWLAVHQWGDSSMNSGSLISGIHGNLILKPVGYYLYPFFDN